MAIKGKFLSGFLSVFGDVADNRIELRHRNGQTIGTTRVQDQDLAISLRHCEEPTGPARSGRPDGSQWRYL